MTGSPKQADGRAWRAWFTCAVLALLFAAVAAAFGGYYLRQVRWFADALEERAHMMLDVQEAAVAAHLRNGKYNPEQLAPIFKRLAQAPLVVKLQLRTGEGVLIQAQGEHPDAAARAYGRSVVIAAETPGGRHGRMMPRGPSPMAGWLPFPREAVTLTVWMDESRLLSNRAGARLQLFLSLLGTALAFGLALLTTLSRWRQRGLEVDLAVAREREVHHRQLAQLGAGLAHETKNPLGLVRGMAQFISEADAPGEVRKQAALIIDEVDRTVRHVNAFLDLAREKEPTQEPVSLDALFSGLEALMRQEALQQRVSMRWTSNHLRVRADESLLRRALLNLVINALKACAQGGEISVTAGATGDGVRISVEDNGSGIAPEDLSAVRRPYFSRFHGGTGLGLSIVDQIARAHGWRLEIESRPGQGTRVSLDGIHPVT